MRTALARWWRARRLYLRLVNQHLDAGYRLNDAQLNTFREQAKWEARR